MNRELLIKARAFFEQIPDKYFDMNEIIDNMDPTGCGAICCGIGHLASKGFHPDLEIKSVLPYKICHFLYWGGKYIGYLSVAQRLFDISTLEALELFGPVNEDEVRSNHKQILLRRIDNFLMDNN
jgi:hypothetical protein